MSAAPPIDRERVAGPRAELRLLTYLAPGLPLGLFEAVAAHLERALGLRASVRSDPTLSAPEPGGHDPFARDEADLGFLCAPGYLWLAAEEPPSVELVPAAFVFDDERCQGRPVYFADLVVNSASRGRASRARTLDDLGGARWVYNDSCSLSGYFSVLAELSARGHGPDFFGSTRAIGSHHAALRAVERGEADCAAIDSNTLRLERRRGSAPEVRVLESFGPFPVQPVVARAGLARERKAAIAAALLAMHADPAGRAALAACGVRRLAPITPADYEPERALLARVGSGALGCEARVG
jgi:ABC-type phosphate/phosphonate transport system substrate-binding protein